MVAKIYERWRGISGNQDTRTISYLVTDATSDQDALTQVELASPLTYDLLPRQNIQVTEIDKKAYANREYDPGGPFDGEVIEELDPAVDDGMYYCEALYSRSRWEFVEETSEKPEPADQDANHNTFSFEQSLTPIRIREGLTTPDRYTPGGAGTANPTDAIKLTGINFQRDGTVEGVDVQTPKGSFSYDYFPDKSAVDQAYQDLVTGLVGKVNSTTFFNKPAGEVLFVSAQGRKRNPTDWEFNFRFEHNKNATGLTIGEGSNAITYNKLGWQYAWVYFDEIDDTNTDGEKRTILVPRQVTVETIYETADLNQLFP